VKSIETKMEFIPETNINEFDYNLLEEKIAQFPLPERDESKLLIARNNTIAQDIFKNIPGHLPENSLLIFNETKVIQARLLFKKTSGAKIELFCLEPVLPTRELQQAFEQRSGVVWKCMVGNSKRWKSEKLQKTIVINDRAFVLTAERIQQFSDHSLIRFEWKPPDIVFSVIMSYAGIMPLPPYMKREAEDSDTVRYQTIYASAEGSVAAPTAGLHFSEAVFHKLEQKNIKQTNVTLHVGAGTFKPVMQNEICKHEMHFEKILVPKKTIILILDYLNKDITLVGTTSVRTVESLYWFGVKLIVDKKPLKEIDIKQWDPYNPIYNCEISARKSLQAILNFMETHLLEVISGQTQLMIVPGYRFRIPTILVTNFHMPKSTLLLLVSAFIGDQWKNAYQFALNNNFRFLSYGDACLFFKKNEE
jgi:S-adenosylmethionine:tRNA ribosyltransferase-isomerase